MAAVEKMVSEKIVALSVALNTLALSTLVYFVMDLSRTMSDVRVAIGQNQATQKTLVKRVDRVEKRIDRLQDKHIK